MYIPETDLFLNADDAARMLLLSPTARWYPAIPLSEIMASRGHRMGIEVPPVAFSLVFAMKFPSSLPDPAA
jgi:hypothetical protein